MESFLTGTLIFVVGALWGSFLNVCIHRMPRGESVIMPGSHCPHCNQAIAWHDNIPLISFMVLGAKCRHCSAGISPRYAGVELMNALLWLGLWKWYGFSSFFWPGIVLFSLVLAVTMTDFETGLIPDKLSFPGMAFGLFFSTLFPEIQGRTIWYEGLIASLIGLLVGGGSLYLTGTLGNIIFKKDTMGGGDIKLLAMLGAFLGWTKIFFVFLFAPILAIPFALFMKFTQGAETIPYGPFLAITGAIYYVAGHQLIKMFFSY